MMPLAGRTRLVRRSGTKGSHEWVVAMELLGWV